MKFRLPTCTTPRRKLTNVTRRFLEAFFTSLLWARVIKYSKRRDQATHVAQVHWADVTIFQRFENYPASRGFFQSDKAFSICEARYIHLCEFREKVRQYCINKFVPTTLLSKNIILFENNTYILVKKFGRRTLRESNDSVKQYILLYTIKKNWARSVTPAQTLCIIIKIY